MTLNYTLQSHGNDDILDGDFVPDYDDLGDTQFGDCDPQASGVTSLSNESPDDPHRLARSFLEDNYGHDDTPTLKHHRGIWLAWKEGNGAYQPVADDDLSNQINRHIKLAFDRQNRIEVAEWDAKGCNGDKPYTRVVSTRLVHNVISALKSFVGIPSHIDLPAWYPGSGPWPAHETMAFENGLVCIEDVVNSRPLLIEPTPSFVTTHALPCNFDPDAPEPETWMRFLRELWPNDPTAAQTLQEWFGYVLTSDTSQQKIAMLIGATRSGKGTIAKVLGAMVGENNVGGPPLSMYAAHFGLADLIGKSLAITADARLGSNVSQSAIVERLLTISGEDVLTIDRKHKDLWTGKLACRLMIISNELPRFVDDSGALVNRLILFRFTESFLNREDPKLLGKLLVELPGILVWSLKGLARLKDRGHFLQPECGKELLQTMEDFASPMSVFVRERCDELPGASVAADELYRVYREWSITNGNNPKSKAMMGKELHAAFPRVTKKRPRAEDGKQVVFYEGLRLK